MEGRMTQNIMKHKLNCYRALLGVLGIQSRKRKESTSVELPSSSRHHFCFTNKYDSLSPSPEVYHVIENTYSKENIVCYSEIFMVQMLLELRGSK